MPPRRKGLARRRPTPPPARRPVAGDDAMGDPEIAAIIAEAPRTVRMPTHVPGWVRRQGVEHAREWMAEQADQARERIAELIARVPPEVDREGPEAVEEWACHWDNPLVGLVQGAPDPRAPLPR